MNDVALHSGLVFEVLTRVKIVIEVSQFDLNVDCTWKQIALPRVESTKVASSLFSRRKQT